MLLGCFRISKIRISISGGCDSKAKESFWRRGGPHSGHQLRSEQGETGVWRYDNDSEC